MKKILVTIVVIIMLIPGAVHAVEIATSNLPPTQLVEESRANLTTLGCVERKQNESESTDVPAGMPYRIIPRDQNEGSIFFCNPQISSSLSPIEGKTLGALDFGFALGFDASLSPSQKDELLHNISLDEAAALDNLNLLQDELEKKYGTELLADGISSLTPVNIAQAIALKGGLWLSVILLDIAKWLYEMSLSLIVWALTPNSFITNPLVTTGWPLVQGIANVGFIVALLFIALSTTLNLNIGGGWKRLLPRLLFAALLINFSLIIAGIILDLTRILMAIFVSLLTTTSLSNIQNNVNDASGLINLVADLKVSTITRTKAITSSIASLIIGWALTLGTLALAVGLIIRYIVLIILLIVSPIAYLAYALPGADGLASKWWRQFFQYAFYGPAAMFFLVIGTKLSSLNADSLPAESEATSILNTMLMAILFAVGAIMSKKMGGTFAVATLNTMKGGAKRAGRWAKQNPKKAAALGATVATGGIGLAGQAAAGGALAIGADRLTGRRGSKYLKGAAKAGYQRIAGTKTAEERGFETGQKVLDKFAPTKAQRAARTAANNTKQALQEAGQLQAGSQASKDYFKQSLPLLPSELQKKETARALSTDEIRVIVSPDSDSTAEQKHALLKNPEAIKKLMENSPQVIQQIINEPTNLETDLPTNLSTSREVVGRETAARNAETNTENQRQNGINRRINQKNERIIAALNRGLEAVNREDEK